MKTLQIRTWRNFISLLPKIMINMHVRKQEAGEERCDFRCPLKYNHHIHEYIIIMNVHPHMVQYTVYTSCMYV